MCIMAASPQGRVGVGVVTHGCAICVYCHLQSGSSPIKAQLRDLYITAAKLIEVDGGKKAIIMFVPFRLLNKYHKIQKTLIEELEKKFRCVGVLLHSPCMHAVVFTRRPLCTTAATTS